MCGGVVRSGLCKEKFNVCLSAGIRDTGATSCTVFQLYGVGYDVLGGQLEV